MRLGFEYPHDEDQRFADRDVDEAPRQVSMRPRGERRNLTTDEKKVKNRLRRRQAADEPIEGGPSMDPVQREAVLLQAMATATPEEQARLSTELEALRTERTAAVAEAREVDLAGAIIRDTLTPVIAYSRHTAHTDWVAEAETLDDDPQAVQQTVLTEASLWFGRTSAEVRADREEFAAQAQGMAQRVASAYGTLAPAAKQAFLDHVGHLHDRTPVTAADLAHFEVEAADDEIELPDNDDELGFEGGVIEAEGAAADSATTNPTEIHEQSGYGVSGLPQDKPIANDMDPLFSEDWPGGEAEVRNPPPSGAGGGQSSSSLQTEADSSKPSDRDGSYERQPEEIETLDNPDMHPTWPWEMDQNTPGSGAANVGGVHTPGQSVADYPQPKKSTKLDEFRERVAASRGR